MRRLRAARTSWWKRCTRSAVHEIRKHRRRVFTITNIRMIHRTRHRKMMTMSAMSAMTMIMRRRRVVTPAANGNRPSAVIVHCCTVRRRDGTNAGICPRTVAVITWHRWRMPNRMRIFYTTTITRRPATPRANGCRARKLSSSTTKPIRSRRKCSPNNSGAIRAIESCRRARSTSDICDRICIENDHSQKRNWRRHRCHCCASMTLWRSVWASRPVTQWAMCMQRVQNVVSVRFAVTMPKVVVGWSASDAVTTSNVTFARRDCVRICLASIWYRTITIGACWRIRTIRLTSYCGTCIALCCNRRSSVNRVDSMPIPSSASGNIGCRPVMHLLCVDLVAFGAASVSLSARAAIKCTGIWRLSTIRMWCEPSIALCR